MDDPGAAVSGFLDGLLITIKPGLLNSIAVFYSGVSSLDGARTQAIIAEALAPKDVLSAPRALVLLCATIDHVLARALVVAPASDAILTQAAEDTGSLGLAAAALGIPLERKHLGQTQIAWASLRANQLSAQKLAVYECKFLMKLVQSSK